MRLWTARVALTLAVVLGLGLAATQPAQGQTFTVLYNFTGDTDGSNPSDQPVIDSHGNLFGTAADDGSNRYGTVWEYTYDGKYVVLHTFDGTDGAYPNGVRLAKGGLFGTTYEGGSFNAGTIFKITPGGTFTTLYNFGLQSNDPRGSLSGVTLDPSGNMYGTSYKGGLYSNGTVWKLSSGGTETVLHNFRYIDGGQPANGDLKRDKQGNLYGVACYGGISDGGTLFEIASDGTFSVLHNFNRLGADGYFPAGSLLEYAGVLYGTAQSGGLGNSGTVWKYNISSRKFRVLHSFSGPDGGAPFGGVGCQQGKKAVCAGKLFGTASDGGTDGKGTVWEIDSSGTFSTLHSFDFSDGYDSLDRPFVDQAGNLFGTSNLGGSDGGGTLWEITAAKKAKRR